ncbi:Os12g0159100, partial [Oryza sativa Japonica Group]
ASPVSFSFLGSFAAVLSFLPNCFHFVAVHGDREEHFRCLRCRRRGCLGDEGILRFDPGDLILPFLLFQGVLCAVKPPSGSSIRRLQASPFEDGRGPHSRS